MRIHALPDGKTEQHGGQWRRRPRDGVCGLSSNVEHRSGVHVVALEVERLLQEGDPGLEVIVVRHESIIAACLRAVRMARDVSRVTFRVDLDYGGIMTDRNVLGGELAECSRAPLTGFYRDGCCSTGPDDLGSHTVCSVVTGEFLDHQRSVGNDLTTPRPEYDFPGLRPGDRWCVCASRWLQSYMAGFAAPVMLRSTNEAALRIVPRDALLEHAADAPDDPSALTGS